MVERGAKVDLVTAAGITGRLPEGFVPRCRGCRYDLSGLDDSRCPECGARFTVAGLIAEWWARKDAPPTNWDFVLGGLVGVLASMPVDVRDPVALVFKVVTLSAMWVLSWVWAVRRREELLDEGHRLLWLWAPCAATAMGLLPNPGLNAGAAGVALIVGGAVTMVAWRRSPAWTAVIATAVLSVPIACVLLMGLGLLASASAGSAQGHYWSSADFPAWYWRGVPGRVRGIDNATAVKLAGVMIGAGMALVLAVVPMWLVVGRAWVRSERKKGTARHTGPRRRALS